MVSIWVLRAFHNNKRPIKGLPKPISTCIACAACIVPIMPTKGEKTPMVAQLIASGTSSGEKIQA
jgi:hypothetical protein